MKRYSLLTILIVCVLIITGCNKTKTKVSIDEFYKQASKLDIHMKDYSQSYGYANKAYQTESDEYKILFVDGKNKQDIHGIFFDEVKNIYAKAGLKNTTTEDPEAGVLTTSPVDRKVDGGSGWESLELTKDDKYYYIIYVDNTYLYMEGNMDNKDLLIKLKDSIKY